MLLTNKMVVEQKTREELINQTKGFLTYSEKIGAISIKEKKDILNTLKGGYLNIYDTNEIKDRLSLVLSGEKFDKLLVEYDKYYKASFKLLKEFVIKNHIFPDDFNFLANNFARLILSHGDFDLEEFRKGCDSGEIEFEGFKRNIKENIDVLKSLGINNHEEFKELSIIIIGGEPEKIKSNINALRESGINKICEFKELGELIIGGKPEKIKSNINALRELGINKISEFKELREVIIEGEPEKIKSNIGALRELGINKISEFKELGDIITSGISENIEALKDLGVNISCEDFNNVFLYDIICFGDVEIIKTLSLVSWDFETLTNFSLIYQGFNKSKIEVFIRNINLLKDLGLVVRGTDLTWFTDILYKITPENIKAIKDSGIEVTVHDFLNYNHILLNLKSDIIKAIRELGLGISVLDFDNYAIGVLVTEGDVEKIRALKVINRENESLDDFVSCYYMLKDCKTEKIQPNITALKSLGYNDVNELESFKYLIKIGEPDKIVENITTLKGLGIGVKYIDEFRDFFELIGKGDPKKIRDNINALSLLGIPIPKAHVDLLDWCYIVENCESENILILKDYNIIHSFEDLKNIKFVIQRAKPDFLIFIKNLGIKEIGDIHIARSRLGGSCVENLKAIENLGLTYTIDDIKNHKLPFEFYNISEKGKTKNIQIIGKLGIIKNFRDLSILSDIIICGDANNIKIIEEGFGIEFKSCEDLIKFQSTIIKCTPDKLKKNIEGLKKWGIINKDFDIYNYNLSNLLAECNIGNIKLLIDNNIDVKISCDYYEAGKIICEWGTAKIRKKNSMIAEFMNKRNRLLYAIPYQSKNY